MKYIRQILVILLFSTIGELIYYFLPFPIPGNIYGMIALFLSLCLGIVKIEQIKGVGRFLLDLMPILFIPSAVGIISQFDQIKKIWIQVIAVTITTTIITMGVTGLATQAIIRVNKRKEADDDDISK